MLSVVIPALNEAPHVGRAVESAFAAGAGEVIVSDGGSSDRTVAIARELGAIVVETASGRGPQQNAGAAAASGQTLLFLHADSWLEGRVEASSGWGCLTQRIDATGHRWRILERGNNWRGRRGRPYGDQAIWCSRSLFDRVGGFPDWPLFEDVAMADRLRAIESGRQLAAVVVTSPRRWQQTGIVRQTVLNRGLLAAFRLGVSPQRLAKWYRAATH